MTHSFPTRRSSDLILTQQAFADEEGLHAAFRQPFAVGVARDAAFADEQRARRDEFRKAFGDGEVGFEGAQVAVVDADQARFEPRERAVEFGFVVHLDRSEEHTSELQSLMRISYAVFCLKQKNT